jgi:hypothetical protein
MVTNCNGRAFYPAFRFILFPKVMAGLLGIFLCLGLPALVRAEISVTASLQPATTNVGEPVQLHVTINGSQRVAEIPSVQVEGAQVQYIGQATQMRLVNAELSVSLTHRYLVSPGRVGELEVPPVEVTVDGRKYHTEPVKLKVLDSGQDATEPARVSPFAEIQLPRNYVYVGEAFPVEVRLGVPSDTRWRIEQMPEFETDAFTKTPFQQPQQRQENRQGRDFDVCGFRTVMTAIKYGKVPIGPLTFKIQLAVPKKRGAAATNPLGNMFDGFPFDNQPPAFQPRNVILEEQRVDIRELPTENRPGSFRGAIGHFRFNVTPAQTKIKAGEPLSVTVQIEGEGNFDRIEMPPMLQVDGWRAYPPEVSFAKSEETGFRGVKTFRVALVPEKAQTESPRFEFSSFDPDTGQYQLQTSVASPLVVEGGKFPESEKPPVAKAAPAEPAAKPEPKPAEKPVEKSALVEEFDIAPKVKAFWNSPEWFWGLQGLLAVVLLGGAIVVLVKKSHAKEGPGRGLRQRAELLQNALAGNSDKAAFFQQAVQIAQLRAGARSGKPESAMDATDVAEAMTLSTAQVAEVSWLFEADAAARFSGISSVTPLKEEERQRVFALLKSLV